MRLSPFNGFHLPREFPDVLQRAYVDIREAFDRGKLPQLSVIGDSSESQRAAEAVGAFAVCDQIFIFGIGGSSLSGQAISCLKANPRLHYLDNVDPFTLNTFCKTHAKDPRTGIIFISKSGTTLETLTQAAVVIPQLQKRFGPEHLKSHVVVLTEDRDQPLRRLAQRFTLPHIPLSSEIGGRFSAFTSVGLVPLLLEGFSASVFLQGAKEALDGFLAPETAKVFLAGAHTVLWLQKEKGVSQHVLMPYKDQLYAFGQWAQQLIGESLGKNGKGLTPLLARGSVDQHSQLQLYSDGPRDKLITLLTFSENNQDDETVISDTALDDAFLFLKGHTVGDVLAAAYCATFASLVEKGCFVRRWHFEELNEATLGFLMMTTILEVLLVAYSWGVNPFDQPAVEDGKRKAIDILCRGNLT